MFHVKQTSNREKIFFTEHQIALFNKGIQFYNRTLTEKQQNQFFSYIELLLEWNQKINLFSKNDEVRLAERHLLESVSWMFKFDELRSPIMDLGSGAGFPGIPISILRPENKVVLVESKKKKAVFLEKVATKLNLNIQIIPERVEEMVNKKSFQNSFFIIISRAVANLLTLSKWSLPLLCPKGVLLAFKGGSLNEETEQLKLAESKSLKFDVNIIDYTVVKNLESNPKAEARKLVRVRLC